MPVQNQLVQAPEIGRHRRGELPRSPGGLRWRRTIGGRVAPASVRSSGDGLTAPIHATRRSAGRAVPHPCAAAFVATARASWACLRPAEPLSRGRGGRCSSGVPRSSEPTTGGCEKPCNGEALCRTRTGDPFLTMDPLTCTRRSLARTGNTVLAADSPTGDVPCLPVDERTFALSWTRSGRARIGVGPRPGGPIADQRRVGRPPRESRFVSGRCNQALAERARVCLAGQAAFEV